MESRGNIGKDAENLAPGPTQTDFADFRQKCTALLAEWHISVGQIAEEVEKRDGLSGKTISNWLRGAYPP